MNERDFVYWLQGFFELTDSKKLTEAQVKMIKEHLALVLEKETPALDNSEEQHRQNLIDAQLEVIKPDSEKRKSPKKNKKGISPNQLVPNGGLSLFNVDRYCTHRTRRIC